MSDDLEILKEFVIESKKIIEDSSNVLNKVEGDITNSKKLQDYGNLVDRIMGGAQSIVQMMPDHQTLNLIGDYAALCKAVGYKASQINDNEQFYDICVALLQDATENLESLIDNIDKSPEDLRKIISNTFLERLRWVSDKFSSEYRASVGVSTSEQKMSEHIIEIEKLIKKIGHK